MVHRLKLHKVLIQSLSFSFDEKYLASLGGQDDNTLVIWDVSKLIIFLKVLIRFNIKFLNRLKVEKL
jgi:WD40 repeat protein